MARRESKELTHGTTPLVPHNTLDLL